MKTRILKYGLFLTILLLSATSPAESPRQPDPGLTPGDTLTQDAERICAPGYAKSVRDVSAATKREVYRLYGIQHRQPGEYEVDHLISLELGGSNSIRNLWPQSFVTQPLNAHIKDKLENKLHDLICSGQLSVTEAQQAIAKDWVKAYTTYVTALPTETHAANGASDTLTNVADPPHPKNLNCPQTTPVKVSKRGIYHLPSDPNYPNTHAVKCLANAATAQALGFRPPKTANND